MKRFSVISDAGSVMILHGDFSVNISNGCGDGRCEVIVTEKRYERIADDFGVFPSWRFTDSLNVYGPRVHLSGCDWQRNPIHEFAPGLYFVNVKRDERLVVIEYVRPLLSEEQTCAH